MSDVLSNTPALLLSNELEISDDYAVTKLEDQKGYEWFVLKPKDEENQYIDIRFAFDQGNIMSMELRDNFGQLTRILFSDIKKNQTIAPELFNFKPPTGVDVLDTTE
jgi:outer membrane lipoprotein carrier protein